MMVARGGDAAHSMDTGLEVQEREGVGGAGEGMEVEEGSGTAEPVGGGDGPGEVDVMSVDFLLSSSCAAEPARLQVPAAGILLAGPLCVRLALCLATLSSARLRSTPHGACARLRRPAQVASLSSP